MFLRSTALRTGTPFFHSRGTAETAETRQARSYSGVVSRLPFVAGAVLVCACGLGSNGLDSEQLPDGGVAGAGAPDDAAGGASSDSRGGQHVAEASASGGAQDAVSDNGSVPLPGDAAGGVADRGSPAPFDASSADVADDGSSGGGEGGTSEGGTDAATCNLPAGATMCCGSIACTSADGTCATAGVCALCRRTCTNPMLPVCCAEGNGIVSCAAQPGSC
jgi:hypothetical protein